MSDRTSAEIFDHLLIVLGKNPTKDHKEISCEMWRFGLKYDFSGWDLSEEAYMASQKLGIARIGWDKNDNQPSPEWLFLDFGKEDRS